MLDFLSHPFDIAGILAIAATAGMLGGLLGVGGSIIIIPGLYFIIGPQQQLFQAAAMIVNVFIAIPATWKHKQADAVQMKLMCLMLPASVIAILGGVWVSNLPVFRGTDGGIYLGRILAVFLIYVIIINIKRLINPVQDACKAASTKFDPSNIEHRQAHIHFAHTHPMRCIVVGLCHGFSAGLMGIGGGAIAVPLQQVLLKLPLRICIANSAFLIVFSSAIGATYKNIALQGLMPDFPGANTAAFVIAGLCVPTAFLASRFGASLTYKLHIRQVRLIFVILLIVSAIKLAQIPLPS